MVGGIVNIASNCYLNTILQCFLHNIKTRQFFLQSYMKYDNESIIKAIAKIADIIHNKNSTAKPTNLLQTLQKQLKNVLIINEQNDANEIYCLIVDQIVKESLPSDLPSESLPSDKIVNLGISSWLKEFGNKHELARIFYGQMIQQVECDNCSVNSHRSDIFISLDIPLYDDKPIDIEESIANNFKNEPIEGFKCDKCNVVNKKESSKVIRLWYTPYILTISIKRFDYAGRKKNVKIKSMPVLLDLKQYVINMNESDNSVYKLSSIVCHFGSLQSGHYYALVLNNDNSWTRIDDEGVYINIDITNIPTEHFYTLFYCKC
jgi:ubiquitin carboxyl-terminal hydrolase 22/27/51